MTVRVIARPDLPATLVVVRPARDDREALIIINSTVPATTIRQLGRVLLDREERSQLGRFLSDS